MFKESQEPNCFSPRPLSQLSSEEKMAEEQQVQHLPFLPSFGTMAIHAGQEPEQFPGWSVVAPISLSVTFKQEAPGKYKVSAI